MTDHDYDLQAPMCEDAEAGQGVPLPGRGREAGARDPRRPGEEKEKEVSEWISVEDRLPEFGRRVLVVAYGWGETVLYLGCLDPGWLKDDPEGRSNFWGAPIRACDWRLSGWSYLRDPDVRYWMPLPEAPNE